MTKDKVRVWMSGKYRTLTPAQYEAYKEAVADRRAWYQYRAPEMSVMEPCRGDFIERIRSRDP
jgi:hypothetical protein